MILRNSTDIPDYFIRRAVAYCCRRLGCKVKIIRTLTVKNRNRGGTSGLAYSSSGNLIVRVAANGTRFYSVLVGHEWQKLPGDCRNTYITRLLQFVSVLAHEIAHREAFVSARLAGKRADGGGEHNARWQESQVIQDFAANCDELIAEWHRKPKAKTTKAVASRAEQTLERNRASLEKWERKLALAKTKLTKYRRAVRASEHYLAAKRCDH